MSRIVGGELPSWPGGGCAIEKKLRSNHRSRRGGGSITAKLRPPAIDIAFCLIFYKGLDLPPRLRGDMAATFLERSHLLARRGNCSTAANTAENETKQLERLFLIPHMSAYAPSRATN
jgi:hypothetical protein